MPIRAAALDVDVPEQDDVAAERQDGEHEGEREPPRVALLDAVPRLVDPRDPRQAE